ncbi:MAG: ABC transporter substrate-binding protein [Ruminococcaceae bacterium]|nr:ABC transporter substrate-binding protein [Oscillospiraceae bacterium]
MTMRKLTALLLAGILLFSLSACSGKQQGSGAGTDARAMRLPFTAQEAIDPYAEQNGCNLVLSELVFEPLFYIDDARRPVNQLAKNYIEEDKTITVTLAQTSFSDGSAVTSEDVIFSFNRARQSSRYKSALSVFESAQSKGSDVVRFTLLSKNVYALNLLSFPIISQKNNRIGSGYYALQESEGKYSLVYNKNHEGERPRFETIELVECADEAAAIKAFNADTVDYLFESLSDGNVRASAIQSQKAKLNNLLFVGINSKKGLLKNKAFRNALNHCINQSELCETTLEGFAVATATPFDAQWSEMGSIVANSVLSNSKQAKAAFKAAGCSYDKMGINLLADEKQITLNLIVNAANNMKIALAEGIKTRLISFGISVELKKMPFDEYSKAIENENFDLYIGEVAIPNDFNLDCFFAAGGGADFGIDITTVQKTYLQFKGGNATLQDFVSVFCEENPLIPIGYRCANVCLNPDLHVAGTISENIAFPQIWEWSK